MKDLAPKEAMYLFMAGAVTITSVNGVIEYRKQRRAKIAKKKASELNFLVADMMNYASRHMKDPAVPADEYARILKEKKDFIKIISDL